MKFINARKEQCTKRMNNMKIGCHVSNSGDEMLLGSVKEALSYKANCFMVYLGPPQSTMRKDASRLNINRMKEELKNNNISIDDVIIHAPYIVNLASPADEKRQFGIDFITREMKVMAEVGAKYMVLHPGAHMNNGISEGLDLIAISISRILEKTKNDNTFIALETMSGKGTECCFDFNQIAYLIEKINSDRIVVCFDTCHTNDAGYDLVNNYEGVLKEFDELIGLEKIKVFHINDSLNQCGSKKDRHANFGFGNIGFDTLMKFVTDERFSEVPKILETPYLKSGTQSYPPYKYEIEMIRNGVFDPLLLEKIVEEV